MRLDDFVPSFLKPLFRPTYKSLSGLLRRLMNRHSSRAELHEYWKKPSDGSNIPDYYLDPRSKARSGFLVKLVDEYAHDTAKAILEVGCNAGRNLHYLWDAGYRNLSGIEISQDAVDLLRRQFVDMAKHIRLYVSPVEEVIRGIGDGQFEVVFTMAVLEHIHKDSEWIFAEIVRVTKNLLITIEDEKAVSRRHFARNYKKIFEPLGLTQLEALQCTPENTGLSSAFVARIFKK